MTSNIRLTKATDAAHKRLSVLIFGEPKVGKTTLAKTLPLSDDSKLFYCAADPGQLALRDKGYIVAQPADGVLSERFFDEVLDHLRVNGHEYEWIFVDGVDEVAEAVLKDKLKTQRDGRKAYGEMADYVEGWMKAIRDIQGVSVVFVTHIEMKDAGEGEVQFHPMFPGKKIQDNVDAWFDMIGCMRMVRSDGGKVERYIQFRREADTRFMVGDRSGVSELYEKPDLGTLFKKIHEAGYETKGTWQEPRPSKEQRKELGVLAMAKGKSLDDVQALSVKMFDTAVRDLTLEQFDQLRKQVEEGVAS